MATKKPLMGQGCVAVVDLGEGSGGGGFFGPNWGPRGQKKLEGRPGFSPSFQGLDLALCCFGGGRQNWGQRDQKKIGGETGPSPLYFKVLIWHCVASVEEDKVAEHLF